MMRLLFKAVMIAVLLLAAMTYMKYLKTGQFSFPINTPDVSVSVPEINTDSFKDWGNEANKVAYKWRDQSGGWQYTSEPPKGGIDYEEIEPITVTE